MLRNLLAVSSARDPRFEGSLASLRNAAGIRYAVHESCALARSMPI